MNTFMKAPQLESLKSKLVYPARTAIAAVLALLAARWVGLPEFYWAPITALVVVQPDFHTALTTAWQQFAGTALGAVAGALLVAHFEPGATVFGLGVLGVGLLSATLKLDHAANRIAAIALAIVFLIARTQPAAVVALHRFFEVSTGIVAGLLLSAVWPAPEPVHQG
jgi:uncharacterized membrane protein YgaE (UPF0421/DUF939 family)